MKDVPEFKSFEDAENTIKSQVLSLCDTYSKTIKQILPTLKKSSTQPKISKNDTIILSDLYSEGNDHLHNLIQLTIELNDIESDNRGLILEISAEVLANTVKYLNNIPKNIDQTRLISNE